jgi:hypothetical protein
MCILFTCRGAPPQQRHQQMGNRAKQLTTRSVCWQPGMKLPLTPAYLLPLLLSPPLPTQPYTTPGGLFTLPVRAARLQLLPGYVPNLQLLATLETLWQQNQVWSALLLEAIAASWQADPSKAPPSDSPMWLALASMAAAVRKSGMAVIGQYARLDHEQRVHETRWSAALLPLLQLGTVALQQPEAGWGALVLASAVQGAALAWCVAAAAIARQEVEGLAGGCAPPAPQQQQVPQQVSRQQVLDDLLQLATYGMQLPHAMRSCSVQAAPASTAAAAEAGLRLGYSPPQYDGKDPLLPLSELNIRLGSALDLLRGLQASYPAQHQGSAADGPDAASSRRPAAAAAAGGGGGGPAAGGGGEGQGEQVGGGRVATATAVPADMPGLATAAQAYRPNPAATTAQVAALAANMEAGRLQRNPSEADAARRHSTLLDLAFCMEACGTVARCVAACSSTVQLLGCAHLGCTTRPPGGLASCEASLGVNRKGSVCGGCGVVRYCSPACAQRDWPEHRRVCRRLAAAAAQRGRT